MSSELTNLPDNHRLRPTNRMRVNNRFCSKIIIPSSYYLPPLKRGETECCPAEGDERRLTASSSVARRRHGTGGSVPVHGESGEGAEPQRPRGMCRLTFVAWLLCVSGYACLDVFLVSLICSAVNASSRGERGERRHASASAASCSATCVASCYSVSAAVASLPHARLLLLLLLPQPWRLRPPRCPAVYSSSAVAPVVSVARLEPAPARVLLYRCVLIILL